VIVDWRTRFGWNWITSVRDQGGSENCWAFAMTALYEAMVRIEHCVWCTRSEGDLARAVGKQAWDFGNFGEARAIVERYGIADPDCFAWSESASVYTAKPMPDIRDFPLSPTPDRPGRTVRIDEGAHTWIDDLQQKKQWLDQVGPLAVLFNAPSDLPSYFLAHGIYTPTTSVSMGIHAVLVVGFDDERGCWIVKNSWGTPWGIDGFGLFAYGFAAFEKEQWLGVRNTNPDPWTKRRRRNGVLLESGNGGAHNNKELFLRRGTDIEHWWAEARPGNAWNKVGSITFSAPASVSPQPSALECPAVVQSTFNRNYELVYRTQGPTVYGRRTSSLQHIYFDQAYGWWRDGAPIDGLRDPVGIPGFVQGSRGAPGDFELVCLTAKGVLEHWTKHNSSPWTNPPGTWYRRARFGSNIAFAGPALVHSRLAMTSAIEQEQGALDYVCTTTSGSMSHFRLQQGGSWTLIDTFATGITSAPVMVEDQASAVDELDFGDFELFVATGGDVQHWKCQNHGSGGWVQLETFGTAGVSRVLGVVQGSSGFGFDVITERTDGQYQQYSNTAGGLWGGAWSIGPVIA
jgi:hypothetical protein